MFKIQTVLDTKAAFELDKFIPEYKDIPKEFIHGHTKWNQLFNDWFFCGINNFKFTLKEGIDCKIEGSDKMTVEEIKDKVIKKALLHINAVMRSWEPKHEHKEAGVAFLLNEWFSDVRYEKNKRD